jgi:hypothetical protein
MTTNTPKLSNQLFHYSKKGVDLNDPDAMVSLAELIDKRWATPRANETKASLYARAAKLGHGGANDFTIGGPPR